MPARAEDLTFDQVLVVGAHAPAVRTIEDTLAARRAADVHISSMTHNPQLVVEPGVRVGPGGQIGPELIASLTQSWNLADLGGARMRAAHVERQELDAATRAAVLDMRLEVAHDWIFLWSAQENFALLSGEREGARGLRALVERAAAAGQRTRLDVADADAYVADTETRLVDADGLIFEMGIHLSTELGRDPSIPLRAVGPVPAPDVGQTNLAGFLSRADALPEARAAHLGVLSARARAVEARAAGGALLTLGGAALIDPPNGVVGSLVVGVTLPIFDQNDRAHAASAGEAARLEGAERQMRLEVRMHLAEAVHEVEHSRERESVLASALVPALEARLALQERSLAAGETTLFRVLDARRALLDGRGRLLAARAERIWAEVKLWLLLATMTREERV